MKQKNEILDLSFRFALDTIAYCEVLEGNQKFVLSRQLLRSGNSIGANVSEAQNAESKQDFVHKMKIAAKEAEETQYWLLLCKESLSYPDPGEMPATIISIKNLLTSIIYTTKKSMK